MEQKTNRKVLKVIILIIAILLAVIMFEGILIFKNIINSTGTKWGDMYFEKLQEEIEEENYLNIINDSIEIKFIQVKENSNPVMVVTFEELGGEKMINIYREKENEKNNKDIIKNFMTYSSGKECGIQLLYNIELLEMSKTH